ncbi:MAG TPA: hypothetical protein VI612_04885 [Candidatus Nanoarchaeia archaeon]|nr:hypothetical protein [Candidatus Nanoarchaeia archaeon]
MPTIDDVVKECQSTYQLAVTDQNKEKYAAFVKRQSRKHKLDDQKNFTLLVDKLMLFSYLIRQSSVEVRGFDTKIVIDKDEKLPALRVRGHGPYLWDDNTLYSIYARREYNHIAHKLPRYTAIIDELGRDTEVVAIWGRRLSYDKDVGRKLDSPRTKAFKHKRVYMPRMGRIRR